MKQVAVPVWHRPLEILGIVTVAVALLAIGVKAVEYANSGTRFGQLLGATAIAFLVADFLCGLVHWAADRLGSPEAPIVGPGFIAPFRAHHADPEDMARHGFVEVNGDNCVVSAPFAVAIWVYYPDAPAAQLVCLFAAATLLFVAWTNQTHYWAHVETPPRLVRWLHRAGLAISPERHSVHHVPPHTGGYCLTTGWMNPVLDFIFPRLEKIILRIFPNAIAP